MGVVATAAVIGLGAARTTVANAAAAPTLTLTSTAFADKGNIPATPTTLKEGLGLGFDASPTSQARTRRQWAATTWPSSTSDRAPAARTTSTCSRCTP